MKKGMGRTGRWSMVALVALALTGVAGCVSRSSAPGANKALGSFAQGGYVLLRWDAGLGVMIWHDLNGESEAHSTGSSSGPIYTERGYARSADGRSLTWEVQTREGKEGEIDIGGARYDLAAGSLFIVTTEGGGTAVRQLVRDLSDVPLDHDGILAFARRDPELSVLLEGDAPTPTAAASLPTAPATAVAETVAPEATSVPSSTAVPTATPLPPTRTPTPAPAAQRILFAPGSTQAQVTGSVPADRAVTLVLGVAAGQFVEMNAAVGTTGQGLRFSITGADGTVVKPMGDPHIRTVVPRTQDYYVRLVSDVGAVRYQLSVLIPVRVRFAAGGTSAEVAGQLAAGQMRDYVVHGRAGQRMIVAPYASRGRVGLVISGADGQVLLSGRVGQPGGVYDGRLPATQDYLIGVRAEGNAGAEYRVAIEIPAEGEGAGLTVVGTVRDVSPSALTIGLAEPVEGIAVIAPAAGSRLWPAQGDPAALRDIEPGMRIQAFGRRGASQALLASEVRILQGTAALPTG